MVSMVVSGIEVRAGEGREESHLYVAASSVEGQMQVLDLAVLAEHVVDGLLVGLLVDAGDDDDPALDGADGRCAAVGLHVLVAAAGGTSIGGGGGLLGLVDLHLNVGHIGQYVRR